MKRNWWCPVCGIHKVEEQGRKCGGDKCKEFVRVGRYADYRGMSYKTVGRWADKGKLEVKKSPGGHRRVREWQ